MITPWKMRYLLRADPVSELAEARNMCDDDAETEIRRESTAGYTMIHTVADGIERIVYKPNKRNTFPPILMVHGMWHNASCWTNWQVWLANRGWQSTAFSLPGHGRSPEQRQIATCSLAYYLRFLSDEAERLDRAPILMGHSMGGALLQWYLRYVDQPKAAVFVASWTSHDILKDCLWPALTIDPSGTLLGPLFGWRFQFRSDRVVRKWFLSEQARLEATRLRSELGPESEIVLMQHRPPKWHPPSAGKVPALWLCAEADAIIPPQASAMSAAHYRADLINIPNAGHDIMLDRSWEEAAAKVANWLENDQHGIK